MQENFNQAAHPSFEEFVRLARPGTTVPVYITITGDYLTPVTAYERLASLSEYSFLLESVVGGERIARYSFLGAAPRRVLQARGHKALIEDYQPGRCEKREFDSVDPLKELETLLAPIQPVRLPGLPTFVGGAVGYAGYDTVRYLEPEKLAAPPPDSRGLPDLLFGIYDELVIFDHVQKIILVLTNVHVDSGDRKTAYDDALERIDRMVQVLAQPRPARLGIVNLGGNRPPAHQSNFTRQAFEEAVLAAKQYIEAGDIFQVVLSQCLRVDTRAAPFDIYRALRMINPSPFMFYLTAKPCTLVGSSPEIMCGVQDGVITNRPLAGTRRRGATPQEDQRLEKELLADPKELAEHVMLVDLGRNDVGRAAAPGSVRISDALSVERYSHVMHITTNVTGRLAEGKTCFDALRVALPVGTVSGAPKIRAMQIIDELEPTRRGPYGGAVGYVDYAGNMDTCIALRTMVIAPPAGRDRAPELSRVYIQVGAGLVADSVPAAEYQETLNKAAGLLQAVALAEAGLG